MNNDTTTRARRAVEKICLQIGAYDFGLAKAAVQEGSGMADFKPLKNMAAIVAAEFQDAAENDPVDAAQTPQPPLDECLAAPETGDGVDRVVDRNLREILIMARALVEKDHYSVRDAIYASAVNGESDSIAMKVLYDAGMRPGVMTINEALAVFDRVIDASTQPSGAVNSGDSDGTVESSVPHGSESAVCTKCGHDSAGWLGSSTTKTCQKPLVDKFPGVHLCGCKCVFPSSQSEARHNRNSGGPSPTCVLCDSGLVLTPDEEEVLAGLSIKLQLSPGKVLRQALRVYQLHIVGEPELGPIKCARVDARSSEEDLVSRAEVLKAIQNHWSKCDDHYAHCVTKCIPELIESLPAKQKDDQGR